MPSGTVLEDAAEPLALAGSHDVLHLRCVHELLEARQLAVANLEHVAHLASKLLPVALKVPV